MSDLNSELRPLPQSAPSTSDEPVVTVPRVFQPPTSAEASHRYLLSAHRRHSRRRTAVPHPPPRPRAPLSRHHRRSILLSHPARLPRHSATPPRRANPAPSQPKLLVGSEALSYIATLIISWFVFPLLWKRSFADGLHCNPAAARRNAFRLIPIGLILSFTVQAISSLISLPKTIPMDDFFRTPSDVWLVTAFGILLAPLFEEVLFRGFLLPAFAIAYDWLSLPRTPAAREPGTPPTTSPARPHLLRRPHQHLLRSHPRRADRLHLARPRSSSSASPSSSAVRLRLRSGHAPPPLIHAQLQLHHLPHAFIGTGGYRHLDKHQPTNKEQFSPHQHSLLAFTEC